MVPTARLSLTLLGCVALGASAFAAPVAEGGRKFGPIMLTGAAEVPGPGDPDGSGTAVAFLNVGQDRVCWELVVNNVDPITAAHIHEGAPNEAGGIRVSFFHFGEPVDLEGCTFTTTSAMFPFDRARLRDIVQNPQNYYVNVHSDGALMAGAIRGQMAKKP